MAVEAARLIAIPQAYDWGKIGSDSAVARLHASGAGGIVDEKKPYAELWMGTHSSGPSSVILPDGTKQLLKEYLGGVELPFLLKVLSIRLCLSIQAHPDKALAARLHAEKPNMYKDDNHKPEMALAVTPFEAMCGFRPISQIANFLSTVPEFRALVGEDAASSFEKMNSTSDRTISEEKDALRAIFSRVMKCTADNLKLQLDRLLVRLANIRDDTKDNDNDVNLNVNGLILRLQTQHPGDVGIFAVYFLNCFKLSIGDAIFLPANEPHAYLAGDCIECMACSDNVVRVGCTPKPRDTDVLCDMLTFKARSPEVMRGDVIDGYAYTRLFAPPVPEFQLERTSLPSSVKSYTLKSVAGHSIVLVYQGTGKLTVGTKSFELSAGGIFLIPDRAEAQLSAAGSTDLLLFRCAASSSKH